MMEQKDKPILKLKGKTLVCIDWANVFGWFEDLKWEIEPEKLFNYLKSYTQIYQQKFYYGKEVGNIKSEEFQKTIQEIGFDLQSKEVKWVPIYLEKQSHLKNLMKNLFDVLDGLAKSNSETSNKLYEIKTDFQRSIQKSKPLIEGKIGEDGEVEDYSEAPGYDEDIYNNLFDTIEELDVELKKMNIDVSNLQQELKKPLMRRKCDFDCEIVMDIMNEINNFDGLILFSGDGDYKAIIEHILNNGKQAIIIHPFGRRGKEFNALLEREISRPYFCPVERLKKFLT